MISRVLSKLCVLSFTLVLSREVSEQTITSPNKPYMNRHYKNQYGPDYGRKWIYFPDGRGVSHIVNLTSASDEQEHQSYLRKDFDKNVEYRLYTSDDKENFTYLDENAKPLDEDRDYLMLNITCLKIITHGWRSTADQPVVKLIKDSYLNAKKCSVITVDWSDTADSIFYNLVANEVKDIGKQVGWFLDAVCNRYNITGDRIHLIGHSLGAQVMGIAGSTSKVTISRITGLDPAKPMFEYPNRKVSEKLDSSDAEFVDIIHTCGGVLGVESPIGTVDFFPNGGTPPQPGCGNVQSVLEACSHSRAYRYFSESISSPEAFPAHKCESWDDYLENRCSGSGYMGENVNRSVKARSKYFLRTDSSSPFGRT